MGLHTLNGSEQVVLILTRHYRERPAPYSDTGRESTVTGAYRPVVTPFTIPNSQFPHPTASGGITSCSHGTRSDMTS